MAPGHPGTVSAGTRRSPASATSPSTSSSIGGGITGAGVALDAASRGLRTALVEKDDFASGTSSKSSKLVHGGLRYLQQREFRLVYENLAERQRLLDNAPHLVTPLPFLIPLFGRAGVVNRSVARAYRSALWLYDLTGGMRIGHRHERVDRGAGPRPPPDPARRPPGGRLPLLGRPDRRRPAHPLPSCAPPSLDHGAVAANHTRGRRPVTGARRPGDAAPGSCPRAAEPFEVRASVVVNAAGVWADDVRALDERRNPHSIRPAKGVHVTVPASAFPCDIAAVIPVRDDHRSIFVVSWGDQVYLGTTDTAYDGPPRRPGCTPEDVDYILDAANAVTTRPAHPCRHHRASGPGCGPLLAPGRAAGAERADRRPLPPPHRADVDRPASSP